MDDAPISPPPALPCHVEDAIALIGGKWKLLIVRLLLLDGPRRFNELQRAIEGISHKVLTQNLRELEGAGIVVRDDASPPVRYRATPSAERLLPLLHALGEWASVHRGAFGVGV